MDTKFWSEPFRWPPDPLGYVFLARAVMRVGSAMLGKDWTGQEVAVPADPQNERFGRDPALARCDAVFRELVKRCESGELVSAGRRSEGGQMFTLDRTVWNTERWHQRFALCQLNPDRPFDMGIAGEGYCWIYLVQESLEKFLLRQPFAKASIEGVVHFSPYLQTMVKVAEILRITPENQPKTEVVKAEIRRLWPPQLRNSKNLVDAMATILREPESQLGRARQRRSATGKKNKG